MKKSRPNTSGKGRPSAVPPGASRRVSPSPGAAALPVVSARWLGVAIIAAVGAAAFCAWATLCFLFWQGSWQLMYHPAATVARTPASANLPFESVGFDTDASGEPQLRGWWVPATPSARYTAIYLHGADGNLGDTVNALAGLHALGLNVFAFDYRGYGQSRFVHPSEANWRQDADSAIRYLAGTRHIATGSIVLIGKDLGANLALETAASHPDLAGVVLQGMDESPTTSLFNDARAHLVPAHWLVSDRWDTEAAASNLLIPSLWFYWTPRQSAQSTANYRQAYSRVPARKALVWLTNNSDENQFNAAMAGWLDQLSVHAH